MESCGLMMSPPLPYWLQVEGRNCIGPSAPAPVDPPEVRLDEVVGGQVAPVDAGLGGRRPIVAKQRIDGFGSDEASVVPGVYLGQVVDLGQAPECPKGLGNLSKHRRVLVRQQRELGRLPLGIAGQDVDRRLLAPDSLAESELSLFELEILAQLIDRSGRHAS